jgi:hypothetical protein
MGKGHEARQDATDIIFPLGVAEYISADESNT